MSVDGGNGGPVNVHVTQVAGVGRRATPGRGLDVRARRLTAIYRKAGAEGRSFRSTFAEHGGSKDPMFKAWQAGKATRGESK